MTSTTRVPAVRAALTGLTAVIAALGVGHLVAGLILIPAGSPFLAVGNATIDRTPAAVKDFAITYFGTNDKPALLVGMAVVLALAGLLIGLISRRSLAPRRPRGTWVAAACGDCPRASRWGRGAGPKR